MDLAEDERDLLLAEVGQAFDQVRSPELRAAYGELLTAVDQGELPEDLMEPLQNLLEIGIESGRIRRLYTAHGEMAATRIYNRTPRGRAVRAAVEGVNESMAGLAGQTLQSLRIAPAGPGSYAVTIATDEATLQLKLDRGGARLQSVEVG